MNKRQLVVRQTNREQGNQECRREWQCWKNWRKTRLKRLWSGYRCQGYTSNTIIYNATVVNYVSTFNIHQDETWEQ